jgi:predicted permease
MEHDEAVRAARAAFGNPERVAAEVAAIDRQRRRDEGRGWRMETIARETRQAARSLARKPTFTAVVVLTLALGIGAVTAVFSVVNASLIRALPFADAERLVVLRGAVDAPDGPQIRGASVVEARDWEAASSASFEEIAAYDFETITLTGTGESERLTGEVVDQGYFELLRVAAVSGRLPFPDEYQAGSAPVVVLSDALWRRRFGADPALVGRAIELNERSTTVVGILPADFRGLTLGAELWVPIAAAGYAMEDRGDRWLGAVAARLRPGVTIERARQDLAAVTDRLEAAYPDAQRDRIVLATPLRELSLGSTRLLMLVILSAAGLLLLIAAINVSNLMLVRASSRASEVMMRRALGASRGALLRHLLLESLLLSAAGAAGGLLLGVWGADLLAAATTDTLLPSWVEVRTDARVFLVVATLMGAIGALVGLLPALMGTRADLATGLRQRGTGARAAGQAPFQRVLVVGEVALALVLLVGAGLMVRSLGAQLRVDPGFDPDGLLGVSLDLPSSSYPSHESHVAAGAELLRRIGSQPGVAAVSLASDAPLRDRAAATPLWLSSAGADEERIRFYWHGVDPGFFATMGIPITSGAGFGAGDQQVAVVSRALVERHFPGQDPIGRSLWLFPSRVQVTIVGVAEDVRHRDLTTDLVAGAEPDVYVPWSLRSSARIELVVRTAGDPLAVVPAVRGAVQAFDANLPPFRIEPLADALRSETDQARFGSLLLGAFSVLAALLAAVGLYGVLAFAVAARTREIAVRMAVGADRVRVRRMVVADGLKLTSIGLALGALAASAGARSLSAFLYGVEPVDLPTYLAVIALMGTVAALASWIPALRATRVDPNRALAG